MQKNEQMSIFVFWVPFSFTKCPLSTLGRQERVGQFKRTL